jgi:predicted Zn-dependent peptidase
MNRLARNELYLKRYVSLDQTMAEINRVTGEDIQAVAQELFRTENFTAVVLGPANGDLQKELQSILEN